MSPQELVDETSSRRRACVARFFPADEIHGRREADALVAAGYRTDFLCVGSDNDPSVEVVDGLTIRRFVIAKGGDSKLKYLLSYLRWFSACFLHLSRRQLFDGGYDIVQVSTMPDHQIFAALVPRLFGARVIVFFKEPAAELFALEFGGGVAKAVGVTSRLAARFATGCLTVSEAHRQYYIDQGIDPAKIGVVSNATPEASLPVRPPEAIDPDLVVIMSHGTIEERWGHEVLVRAMAEAVKERPNLRLVFTGKGSFQADVERLVDKLGIIDVVEFRGFVSVDDLASLMARADIGVVAQLSNSYSNLVHTGKMYDFIMRDVAVIASRLSATEADFPRLTFYDAGDPSDLARELVRLADDPELRGRLAKAAKSDYDPVRWELEEQRYVEFVVGRPLTTLTG